MSVTISGTTITSTYNLTNPATQNPLTVASTGLIDVTSTSAGAIGIFGTGFNVWTIVNLGTVESVATQGIGIYLLLGGIVTNGASGSTGALISGDAVGIIDSGSRYRAAGTVINFGTITSTGSPSDGIFFGGAGYLINGSGGSDAALIDGYEVGVFMSGSASTVINFGTITGTVANGVFLTTGGSVTNGANGATTAMIIGGNGIGVAVDGAAGTLTNFGTVTGVFFFEGGAVTNGSSSSAAALISGGNDGIEVLGSVGSVTNFGTVVGPGIFGSGVALLAGGSVTNGAAGADGATIAGGSTGIEISGTAGTVDNFGTIAGVGAFADGIYLKAGGGVANGTSLATAAVITGGHAGVGIIGAIGAVTNFGMIEGSDSYSYGVGLGGGGTVTNFGTIEGFGYYGHGVGLTSGSVINGASNSTTALILGNGDGVGSGYADGAVTLTNFGTIAGTGTYSDAVALGAGGTVINGASDSTAALISGGIGVGIVGAATVINFGTIVGNSGFGFAVPTNDSAGVTIINEGIITGAGGVAIRLGAGNDAVIIEAGSQLVGAVGNLQPGDTFDLPFMAFDPQGHATVASNLPLSQQLQVVENGSTFTIALDPSQNFSGDIFQLGTDTGSGTLVTEQPACFCRGTLILTPAGEVPVETLAIDDLVTTIAGEARAVKWIGRRSYSGLFAVGRNDLLPIRVAAGALAAGSPRRDLRISPNHALYLEGVLIEARDLVNSMSVVQEEAVASIEYFHVELDSHDVLVAEGAPAESYVDDDDRMLFHNAHEFRAFYPAATARPARYCAPRQADGLAVERARALIARRAGLPVTVEAVGCGPLRGQIDAFSRGQISGWAQDEANPELPVCLDIIAGGRSLGQVVANRYRADLRAAGLGSGRHAFAFMPPAGFAFAPRAIAVRRSRDGAPLSAAIGPGNGHAIRPRRRP